MQGQWATNADDNGAAYRDTNNDGSNLADGDT